MTIDHANMATNPEYIPIPRPVLEAMLRVIIAAGYHCNCLERCPDDDIEKVTEYLQHIKGDACPHCECALWCCFCQKSKGGDQ